MKVNTDIRRLDLVYFNILLLPGVRSTYTTTGTFTIAIFAFLLWNNGAPDTAHHWLAMAVASFGGGIVAMAAATLASIVFILTTSSKRNGILGKHEYEITAEGLVEKTRANESLNRWSGIQEIRKVGSFLLFRISGYLYHVIPARSFDNEKAFREFIEKAKNDWQKPEGDLPTDHHMK